MRKWTCGSVETHVLRDRRRVWRGDRILRNAPGPTDRTRAKNPKCLLALPQGDRGGYPRDFHQPPWPGFCHSHTTGLGGTLCNGWCCWDRRCPLRVGHCECHTECHQKRGDGQLLHSRAPRAHGNSKRIRGCGRMRADDRPGMGHVDRTLRKAQIKRFQFYSAPEVGMTPRAS